jgi:hypothetical protein
VFGIIPITIDKMKFNVLIFCFWLGLLGCTRPSRSEKVLIDGSKKYYWIFGELDPLGIQHLTQNNYQFNNEGKCELYFAGTDPSKGTRFQLIDGELRREWSYSDADSILHIGNLKFKIDVVQPRNIIMHDPITKRKFVMVNSSQRRACVAI